MRPIRGFPDYFVTWGGDVFSTKRKPFKKLKLLLNRCGYLQVCLYKNGKQYSCKVHRLVLIAYCSKEYFSGAVTRHLDGNKTNNRLWNLRWGTTKDNSDDDLRLGRRILGEQKQNASISDKEAKEILHLKWSGISAPKVASIYGAGEHVVKDIWRYRSWKHLGKLPKDKQKDKPKKGNLLNSMQAREILSRKGCGISSEKVGLEYGISGSTVRYIWRRDTWKCLDLEEKVKNA